MNKNMMIHEGELSMLFDLFDAMKNSKSDAGKKTPLKGMSSIARAVANMTLTFPVICSRGISIENACMVSKAIEKNAVSMLQRLLSAYQISDESDLVAYVQQFHKNVSGNLIDLDDIFKLTEGGYEKMTPHDFQMIKEAMSVADFYLPTDINETSLRDFKVCEGAAIYEPMKVIKEADEPELGANGTRDAGRVKKDAVDFFSKQIPDSDFKKANELMPTNMVVNFTVVGDDGKKIDDFTSGVIGVKAKLYPVGSNDVVTHIAERNQNNNWLTNFFRATTKEISFIKDFVLALDKAKVDAMSHSVKKSSSDKMWNVLERRATSSKIQRLMRSNNGAAAITTLCMSQEEVEYLRKTYNVDVEKQSIVRGLLENLNLLCVVIVDETLEVAKFCYDDGEAMWETISFTHLERESSGSEYKKVINMMTKAR